MHQELKFYPQTQTQEPKRLYIKNRVVFHKPSWKKASTKQEKTKELIRKLNEYFETKINIPRIRHGKHQTLETLINEEACLLAKI